MRTLSTEKVAVRKPSRGLRRYAVPNYRTPKINGYPDFIVLREGAAHSCFAIVGSLTNKGALQHD